MKRRWTIMLTTLCLLGVFGAGAFLVQLTDSGQFYAIGYKVEQAKVVGAAIRMGLIVTVTVLWSRGIRLLNRRRPQKTAAMLNAKWRVVSWLIALEIFVGQGLANALVQAMAMRQ